MLFQLFQFFMNIIGHILKVWTKFEVVAGVNYLEFTCAGLLITFFCYIIYGPIKTVLDEERLNITRESYQKIKSNFSYKPKHVFRGKHEKTNSVYKPKHVYKGKHEK